MASISLSRTSVVCFQISTSIYVQHLVWHRYHVLGLFRYSRRRIQGVRKVFGQFEKSLYNTALRLFRISIWIIIDVNKMFYSYDVLFIYSTIYQYNSSIIYNFLQFLKSFRMYSCNPLSNPSSHMKCIIYLIRKVKCRTIAPNKEVYKKQSDDLVAYIPELPSAIQSWSFVSKYHRTSIHCFCTLLCQTYSTCVNFWFLKKMALLHIRLLITDGTSISKFCRPGLLGEVQ